MCASFKITLKKVLLLYLRLKKCQRIIPQQVCSEEIRGEVDLHLEPKHHQRKEVGLSLNLQETSLLQQFAYDYCHSVKILCHALVRPSFTWLIGNALQLLNS